MTEAEEFLFIASVWNKLSGSQKEEVADLYVKNRENDVPDLYGDRAAYVAAMKPALQAFGHIPLELSTSHGAEEYEEIMLAEELIHGA